MSALHFRFSDRPIRQKVTLLMIVGSVIAVIAAVAALLFFQIGTFRSYFRRDLASIAAMMADKAAAYVAANDVTSIRATIGALAAKPEILGARVLRSDGVVLGEYGAASEIPSVESEGTLDQDGTWIYTRPIVVGAHRIGTVQLAADYSRIRWQIVEPFPAVTAGVLAGSLILVLLLTARLQSFISGPIQDLAAASQSVARDGDLTIRVPKRSDDELGQLTDAFNKMLDRIQAQERALRHEIGKRARIEQEAQSVQQQLVDASRMAGMAEIATGVLHNVGNVLNSVNVAASQVSEKLRASKISGLERAVSLFIEHKSDLADYLTRDPQGQRLPGYLEKLSQFLTAENAESIAELERLGRNVEHIKEIVAMQQSYARVAGVMEKIAPEKLLEDAVQMNTGSFARHGIELIREIEQVPQVNVDKHKTLQILINLIRNAKHALEDSTNGDRRLTVRLAREGQDRVRFVVEDTGVGIPSENLKRIFQHGFTTKKNGHGFGLHSGALAAKEMGGTLSAYSKGVGCGAAFTLELPVAPEATPA